MLPDEQAASELLLTQCRAALEQLAVENGWPAGFFTQTAGAIDDLTYERGEQGVAEERLSFDLVTSDKD